MADQKVPSAQEIAQRAYSLYVEGGYKENHDFEDWIAAERELNEQAAAAPRKKARSRKPAMARGA